MEEREEGGILKKHLEHLDFLHSWNCNAHKKNYTIVNTINIYKK